MANVAELISYPVKGCAGIPLSEAVLTQAGLAHDRTFMIIDEDGGFRSQRRDPRMAVIRPAISTDGGELMLSAPGAGELRVDVDLDSARRDVELFGKPYRGIDQGEDAAGWLSELLGTPCRLVRVPPEHERVTSGAIPGTCGYADGHAVLATSRASLDALNRRLAEEGEPPVPMSRFRPNIVIDGWEEPHEEDRARMISISDARLGYAKLALRCVVTTIDQSTGVKTGPQPLRAFAGYRRAVDGGVAFGSKFAVLRTGKLAVGDAVTVGAWGDSEL